MKLSALFFLLISFNLFATPTYIEFIFLSPDKTGALIDYINKKNEFNFSKKVAQAELSNCTPMGDGCFHPQYGYIEKKIGPKIIPDEELKLKTFNATEVNLVNCDKEYYFDIYCGKESNRPKNTEVEIWFDTSSSLKSVDYNRDPNRCKRRDFLESVQEVCKEKLNTSIYNTAKKEIGENASVCLNYGTNDQKRLLTWMKDSNAKTLLIVTDIDEMSEEMQEFLDKSGAKIIGNGVKAFTPTDLVNYSKEFVKFCR